MFPPPGSIQLTLSSGTVMQLTLEDARALQAALARALNTWEPEKRPMILLELSDSLVFLQPPR